jgi:hypothetical protein
MEKLVCTESFEGFSVGDEVVDPDVIAQLIADGREPYFVRIAVDEEE